MFILAATNHYATTKNDKNPEALERTGVSRRRQHWVKGVTVLNKRKVFQTAKEFFEKS
jgi:hypothetical protein